MFGFRNCEICFKVKSKIRRLFFVQERSYTKTEKAFF